MMKPVLPRRYLKEGGEVVGEAGGTPIVPTGLQSNTVAQSPQTDLALEVIQGAALCCCVV